MTYATELTVVPQPQGGVWATATLKRNGTTIYAVSAPCQDERDAQGWAGVNALPRLLERKDEEPVAKSRGLRGRNGREE